VGPFDKTKEPVGVKSRTGNFLATEAKALVLALGQQSTLHACQHGEIVHFAN
jgi:hypothetical protein